MPKRKKISQRPLNRLSPITQRFAQEKGMVPQLSNMVYTERGSLVTCDGTDAVMSSVGGGDTSGHGAFMSVLGYNQPTTPTNPPASFALPPTLAMLQSAPSRTSAVPAAPVLTATAIGDGTLLNGNYTIKLVGVDGAGGLTTLGAGATVNLAGGNNSIHVVCPAIGSLTGFYAVVTAAPPATFTVPANVFLIIPGGGSASSSFNLLTTVGAKLFTPPAGNTTTTTVYRLINLPNPYFGFGAPIYPGSNTYGDSSIIATFPSANLTICADTGIISPGVNLVYQIGHGGVGDESILTLDQNGGFGSLSALSQLVQYANGIFFVLGAGYPPFWSPDGVTAPVAVLNNWSGSIPIWTAAQTVIPGYIIQPAVANGHLYICVQGGVTAGGAPTFPTASKATVAESTGTVIWAEYGASSTVAPRGAAHACNHLGFLWIANTSIGPSADGLDGPNILAQSNLGDPNTWNPTNRATVGQNDGQVINGISPLGIAETGIPPDERLVVFKNYSTYLVEGAFGGANFAITQAKTDLGCIAPRTIVYVWQENGLMRLTHAGVALFDGTNDDLKISLDIHPFLFNVPESGVTAADFSYLPYAHAALTSNPPMYIMGVSVNNNAGMINRLLCLDLQENKWTVIDLPFNIFAMGQSRQTTGGQIVQTLLGGYTDGVVRQWQAGDTTWDTGGFVSWSVTSPEVYTEPTQRTYFNRATIRTVMPSGPVVISAIVSANGTAQSKVTATQYTLGSNEYQLEIPVGLTAINANAKLSGAGPVELDSIDWEVSPKSIGSTASTMAG